jgi:TolA-binding protein
MNPELEAQIEAYLFAEMSENEAAQFENDARRDAELQTLIDERRLQKDLLQRAFLRQKVRDAQNEASDLNAETPDVEPAKIISMRPFRFAAAAALAAVLAAGAYFLWNQNEKLQDSIADTQAANELLKEKLQKPAVNAVENTPENTPIAATEIPQKTEEVKVLDEKKAEKPPKMATGPKILTDQTPQTYSTTTRSPKTQIENNEGERIFKIAYQKPNLSQFKGTSFSGFAALFDKKKYADAIRILNQMDISSVDADARDLILGIAHLENGDFSDADKHLQNVFDPPNQYFPDAQWWLALTLCKEGKLKSARELFQTISKTKGHIFQEKAVSVMQSF